MFGQPREKAILKARSPPILVEVEELWRASSTDGVTGCAGVGRGRRVKARSKLMAKGPMAQRGKDKSVCGRMMWGEV